MLAGEVTHGPPPFALEARDGRGESLTEKERRIRKSAIMVMRVTGYDGYPPRISAVGRGLDRSTADYGRRPPHRRPRGQGRRKKEMQFPISMAMALDGGTRGSQMCVSQRD
jgi:hypothetical protein